MAWNALILSMRNPLRLGEIIEAVRIKLSIPLDDVATRSGIEPTTPGTSGTGMSSEGIWE
jgi:hypothetical protein